MDRCGEEVVEGEGDERMVGGGDIEGGGEVVGEERRKGEEAVGRRG